MDNSYLNYAWRMCTRSYVLHSLFQVVEKLSDDMMITYMVTEPVAGGMISRRCDVMMIKSTLLVDSADRVT